MAGISCKKAYGKTTSMTMLGVLLCLQAALGFAIASAGSSIASALYNAMPGAFTTRLDVIHPWAPVDAVLSQPQSKHHFADVYFACTHLMQTSLWRIHRNVLGNVVANTDPIRNKRQRGALPDILAPPASA